MIPRGVRDNQQGYLDLQLDDFEEGDIMAELRSAAMGNAVESRN